MKKRQRCVRLNALALAFLSAMALVGVLPCMSALYAATDVFPTKGVVYNPGGGSAPTNESVSLFVGARQGSDGIDIGVWKPDGTLVQYIVDDTYGQVGQQTVYPTGSGVIFNNLLYIFVAEYSGFDEYSYPQPVAIYDIVYYTLNPTTYAVQGGRNVLAKGVETFIPSLNWPLPPPPPPTPLNVGATVWNGAIYVVGTPSTNAANAPVVWSSGDGQNWSMAVAWSLSTPFPSVIHDALTISSDEVPGLSNAYPSVSDSVIMVVGSFFDSEGDPAPNSASVAYYDPASQQWMPESPITLPAPTKNTSNPWVCNAVAYFGTVSGQIDQSDGWCDPYVWSPDVPATLHVMAVLDAAEVSTLSHWYLDPTSGSWTLDEPCGGADQIWWGGQCMVTSDACSMAVAPYYYTSNCTTDLCTNLQMFSGAMNWNFSGPQHAAYQWNVPSDYWEIYQNAYGVIEPADYMTSITDDLQAAMRQMWLLHGVIAGVPPFDGTAFSAANQNLSSLEFGYQGSQTNQQQATWSTNFTFGMEDKMGPPFFKTKLGFQSSMGLSVTQGESQSMTFSISKVLGTNTQSASQFGQLGWAYMSGPAIQPELYQALWAKDAKTYLDYSQVAMTIDKNPTTNFYPFYLQNPEQVDTSDLGTGVFGLMAGSTPYPLSSDILNWSLQPQWDNPPENVDPTSYTVKVGQVNNLSMPLQSGSTSVTQSFVSSQTTLSGSDSSYQTTESISVKLTLPPMDELPRKLSGDSASFTTSVDMSQGYDMQTSSQWSIDESLALTYFVNQASTITVYPYLLQATKPNAPWVPTGYTGPLPWLLTWYAMGLPPDTGTPAAAPDGKAFGRSPLPMAAGGKMTGHAAHNVRPRAPMPQTDAYFVKGGSLAFVNAQGNVIDVAMTACDFDPSIGVTVSINQRKISLTSNLGVWTRTGDRWSYRSKPGKGSEVVTLTLNFALKSWDLDVEHAYFGWYTDPLNPLVTVTLDLNGLYVLTNRIRHDTSYTWQADLSGLSGQDIWVSSITVVKNCEGEGKVRLNGKLPNPLRSFGDFSVSMNGDQKDLPLRNTENFVERLARKRPIVYRDGSATFMADIRTGDWWCEIDTGVFHNPSPDKHKDGKTDLKLLIGGKKHFGQRIKADNYTMFLSFLKEKP